MSMNTGKHKIWICITPKNIHVKLTEKKIGTIFCIPRGKGKRRKSVKKRSDVRKMLGLENILVILAYNADITLGFYKYIPINVSEKLYRKIKDDTDMLVQEYESEFEYAEEFMVF